MRRGRYASDLVSAQAGIAGWRLAAMGLLAADLVLAIVIAGTDTVEKTIIVPPNLERPFWVKGSEMSPEYLEEMARYLSGLAFNATPKSVEGNIEIFLRYVAPEAFGDLRTRMAVQAERVKRDNVSTAFYPVSYQTLVSKRQSVITGDFVTMVGKQVVSTTRRSWRLGYSLESGRLSVSEFVEVENEHPFEAADAAAAPAAR